MTDTRRDTSLDEAVSLIDRAGEQAPKMLEKIFAAAQPGAVFGQPLDAGSYTLITAAEVTSGGGFGVGMGRGPTPKPDAKQSPPAEAAPPAARQSIGGGGFGGGGGSMGRPVAIIAIGPSGVTVRPGRGRQQGRPGRADRLGGHARAATRDAEGGQGQELTEGYGCAASGARRAHRRGP